MLTDGGLRDTYELRYFALTDSRSGQGTKSKYPAQSRYFFATSGIAVLGNEIHKGILSLAAPVSHIQAPHQLKSLAPTDYPKLLTVRLSVTSVWVTQDMDKGRMATSFRLEKLRTESIGNGQGSSWLVRKWLRHS